MFTGPNPYHRSILMWSFQLTEYHNYQGDGDKKIDVFQAVACPEGRQHHRTITMATPFLRYPNDVFKSSNISSHCVVLWVAD